MDSVLLVSKQNELQHDRRTSLANIFNFDKFNASQIQLGPTQKHLEKLKQTFRLIQKQASNNKFQQFDLRQMSANQKLIKNNRQYAQLLDCLKIYNKKLAEARQTDIVNYRLYQFLYFTLRVCTTKTEFQTTCYLKQVNSWLNDYNRKREIIIHSNKRQSKKSQEDAIRQTYKSNLPLEIDQYNRKICNLSTLSNKKQLKNSNRDGKMKTYSNKFYDFYDHSQQEHDVDLLNQRVEEQQKHQDKKKNSQFELPDLRSYKMQVAKLRSIVEEREDKKMLELMKKNQTRIQSQSSNNFYKPLKNRNDIFYKTIATSKDDDQKYKKTDLEQGDSSINTKRDAEDKNQQLKQNRIIVNSTWMGFNQIKKKNLHRQLGRRNDFNSSSTFPRFFANTTGFLNGKQAKAYELELDQQAQPCITNISGLNLLRNPFQITKNKKDKKNR